MLTPRMPHFTPTAPAIYARRRIGVNADVIDASTIAIMQKIGITQCRVTIYWSTWVDARDLDSDGQPDNIAYQDAIRAALALLDAAGIAPLIMVHSPPPSYAALASGIANMPAFMAGLAAMMPGRTWQIMNEVDDAPGGSNNGWFGTHGVDSDATRGDWYGQLLGPVYDAIKASDATATVVSGATGLAPAAFWTAALARAPAKADAICLHCYGEPIATTISTRSIAARAVIGGLPLFCTEWGSTSADDATQASLLGPGLAENDANNRFDRMYLYTLVNGSENYFIAYTDGRLRHAAMLLRDRPAS